MSELDSQIIDRRVPVYTQEQVDQLILTPEVRSSHIIKKTPSFKKIPVYAVDLKGNRIPLKDENGNFMVNPDGSMKYLIKRFKFIQNGWKPKHEFLPASELFNIDSGTSNISGEAVRTLLFLMFRYNHILALHQLTEVDYSIRLHTLRNDIASILNSAKSYKGGTIQAIKTFRTINDANQFIRDDFNQQKPKGIKDMIFGGVPKKQEAPNRNEYTAFT